MTQPNLQFRTIEVDRQPRRTHAVRLLIEGLPPGLLMNPMDEHTLQALALGQKPKQKPKDRDERGICEDKIYRNAEGVMCLPQTWLWAALTHAGRQIGYGDGKSKVSTADSTKLPEFLTFSGDNFPFLDADSDGNVPWIPNLVRGVNVATDGATGIVRPLIKPGWKAIIMIEFHAGRMPMDTMIELVTKAGEIAGLGDFRPQKRGPYGTFQVIGIEVAELFDGADKLMVKVGKKPTKAKGKKGAEEETPADPVPAGAGSDD